MAAANDLMQLAIENGDEDLIALLIHSEPVPRGVTYDVLWPKFDLTKLTDDQCLDRFRFLKEDIQHLSDLLGLPEKFIVQANGSVCRGFEALCILLRRFVYPNRLTDLEEFFGRPRSTLSLIINQTVEVLHDHHHHRFDSFDNPWLDDAHLQLYADAISDKGAPLDNCIGFIDGTVRPICRPTIHQRVCYNGHKRIHALKFQSIVIPCGVITHLFGPLEGRRHDCALLRISGIMDMMEARGATDRNGLPYSVFGDPAYPIRGYLQSPYRGANLNVNEQEFNSRMSSVRQCVEWEFGKMLATFAFLDFRKNLKVLLSPVGKYYLVGGLLTNCHTCIFGNQTSQYFGLDPPSLEDYLS